MRARYLKLGLLAGGITSFLYFAGGLIAAWILVRPGSRRNYDCIPQIRYGKLQPLTLLTADGLRLHAWVLLSREASPEHWVLLLHGYRSDRSVLQLRARFFFAPRIQCSSASLSRPRRQRAGENLLRLSRTPGCCGRF